MVLKTCRAKSSTAQCWKWASFTRKQKKKVKISLMNKSIFPQRFLKSFTLSQRLPDNSVLPTFSKASQYLCIHRHLTLQPSILVCRVATTTFHCSGGSRPVSDPETWRVWAREDKHVVNKTTCITLLKLSKSFKRMCFDSWSLAQSFTNVYNH